MDTVCQYKNCGKYDRNKEPSDHGTEINRQKII